MTGTTTAELVIYAPLSIPTLYILFKHGRAGLIGWAYLLVFCSLRIVGGAMALSGNASASIISSIGLSPLLLAAFGILKEARHYYSEPWTKTLDLIITIAFHLVVTTGVAILASGASNLQSSDVKPSDTSKDIDLVKVGISLLTFSWAFVAILSVWALAHPAQGRQPKSSTAAGTKLLWSVLLSNIFSGIRVIYTLVAMVTQDKTLNPQTGSLAIRVILGLIPELISALGFIIAGLITRNAASDYAKAKKAAGGN